MRKHKTWFLLKLRKRNTLTPPYYVIKANKSRMLKCQTIIRFVPDLNRQKLEKWNQFWEIWTYRLTRENLMPLLYSWLKKTLRYQILLVSVSYFKLWCSTNTNCSALFSWHSELLASLIQTSKLIISNIVAHCRIVLERSMDF